MVSHLTLRCPVSFGKIEDLVANPGDLTNFAPNTKVYFILNFQNYKHIFEVKKITK